MENIRFSLILFAHFVAQYEFLKMIKLILSNQYVLMNSDFYSFRFPLKNFEVHESNFSLKFSNCTHFTALFSCSLASPLNSLFTTIPSFLSKTTPSFHLYVPEKGTNLKSCRFESLKVVSKKQRQNQLLCSR